MSMSETEAMWDGACMKVCEKTATPQGECFCGYHMGVSRDATPDEMGEVAEAFNESVKNADAKTIRQLHYEAIYG